MNEVTLRPGRHETEAVMKCGEQLFSLDSGEAGDVYFDFTTPDIAAAKKFLLSKGCEAVFVASPSKIFFKDPNGMSFRVCEAP